MCNEHESLDIGETSKQFTKQTATLHKGRKITSPSAGQGPGRHSFTDKDLADIHFTVKDWLMAMREQLKDCIENGFHSAETCTRPPNVFQYAAQFVPIWVLKISLSVKCCVCSSQDNIRHLPPSALVNSIIYRRSMTFQLMGSILSPPDSPYLFTHCRSFFSFN